MSVTLRLVLSTLAAWSNSLRLRTFRAERHGA